MKNTYKIVALMALATVGQFQLKSVSLDTFTSVFSAKTKNDSYNELAQDITNIVNKKIDKHNQLSINKTVSTFWGLLNTIPTFFLGRQSIIYGFEAYPAFKEFGKIDMAHKAVENLDLIKNKSSKGALTAMAAIGFGTFALINFKGAYQHDKKQREMRTELVELTHEVKEILEQVNPTSKPSELKQAQEAWNKLKNS